MSAHGCLHLNNFKAAKGTRPYRLIHSFFVACTSSEARKRKVITIISLSFDRYLTFTRPQLPQAKSCLCHVCQARGPRLHACLHCIFFGCYDAGHIQAHCQQRKHFLGKNRGKIVETGVSDADFTFCSQLLISPME